MMDNVHPFRYITEDMLKRVLPLPAKKDDESLLVMVCGPPGFMKLISGDKTKDYKQVWSVSVRTSKKALTSSVICDNAWAGTTLSLLFRLCIDVFLSSRVTWRVFWRRLALPRRMSSNFNFSPITLICRSKPFLSSVYLLFSSKDQLDTCSKWKDSIDRSCICRAYRLVYFFLLLTTANLRKATQQLPEKKCFIDSCGYIYTHTLI